MVRAMRADDDGEKMDAAPHLDGDAFGLFMNAIDLEYDIYITNLGRRKEVPQQQLMHL